MDINESTHSKNSEEVIFYLDLSTDFMKKRTLSKAIDSLMESKYEIFNDISYGLVLFKHGKDLFSIYNKSPNHILEIIDDIWDERDDEGSYLENGLYEILAHIFSRSRKGSKIYQVIVFSDSVSKLSDEYHTALYNLILKAKNFSTTINIIRLGEDKFYEDDVKLKVITSETLGATLYCNNRKNIDTYLQSLVKSKEDINILKSEADKIQDKDYLFYEKLATDLITLSSDDENICILCEEEVCPICETHSDQLHKCYNCNAPFHNCCAAEYSINNKVGFSNIFRCPRCGALLKLDKHFVDKITKEKKEQKEIEEGEEPISRLSKGISDSLEKDTEKEEKTKVTSQEPVKKRVKVGGFFGSEIEINSSNEKSSKNKIPQNSNKRDFKKEVSITSLRPPKSDNKLKLCPICGATVKNSLYCPVCGSKID